MPPFLRGGNALPWIVPGLCKTERGKAHQPRVTKNVPGSKNRTWHVPETDKFSNGNMVELQEFSCFKNPKYPQKYPHSKNILVDVKTA